MLRRAWVSRTPHHPLFPPRARVAASPLPGAPAPAGSRTRDAPQVATRGGGGSPSPSAEQAMEFIRSNFDQPPDFWDDASIALDAPMIEGAGANGVKAGRDKEDGAARAAEAMQKVLAALESAPMREALGLALEDAQARPAEEEPQRLRARA